MGDNPATSVTDRYGQVHGITGLYIADMSVVNLTSPSNPNTNRCFIGHSNGRSYRRTNEIDHLFCLKGGLLN